MIVLQRSTRINARALKIIKLEKSHLFYSLDLFMNQINIEISNPIGPQLISGVESVTLKFEFNLSWK